VAVIAATVALAGVITAAVVAAGWLVTRYRGTPGDPVTALGKNLRLRAMTQRPAAQAATGLRGSLSETRPRDVGPDDTGLALGRLLRPGRQRGPEVFASWEDTVVAVMAPRSGKTTAQAVPFALSAPGAVIATSNKADLWAATTALREQATGGQVWLFDLQHITWQPQIWWWDLLAGLRTVEDAHRQSQRRSCQHKPFRDGLGRRSTFKSTVR
jgi:hypothetical protein